MVVLFLMFIIIAVIVICAVAQGQKRQEEERQRITNDIYSRGFLYYKDFENRWIISSARGKYGNENGFKYQDGPGCYVITIYDHPIECGEFDDYENVYVGQSVNICQRVHAHFNGKGNGDVYADIKYGKWVYVSLVRCERQEMNRVEKELIAAFGATASYNKTCGGARERNY